MLQTLRDDLVDAWRQIARSPGLSLTVLAVVAAAIGGGGGLFSMLNALAWRPLPVPRPAELVTVIPVAVPGRPALIPLDAADGLIERLPALRGAVVYTGGGLLPVEDEAFSESLIVEMADASFFDLLGARPHLGRLINRQDTERASHATSVVISFRFWQRHYASREGVIGRSLVVRGIPLIVIGVAPPGFAGLQVDAAPDIWLPVSFLRRMTSGNRPVQIERIVGRLGDGVSVGSLNAELEGVWPHAWSAHQASPTAERPRVQADGLARGISPLRTRYEHLFQGVSLLAGMTLLAACLSIGGLLVSRQRIRGADLVLRSALGASSARLMRQEVFAAALVVGVSLLCALPLAWWVSRRLGSVIWTGLLPMALSVTPDLRVVVALAATALLVAVLVAVFPIVAIARLRRLGLHLFGGRRSSRTNSRSGRALVVVMVAFAWVLIHAAGTFAVALVSLRSRELGFRSTELRFARFIQRPPDGYRGIDEASYYPELARRLEGIPGVRSVAFSFIFPNAGVFPEAARPASDPDTGREVTVSLEVVSPRFFETAGIPLVRGRAFAWSDTADGIGVAIISQNLEAQLFPEGGLGQRLVVGKPPSVETVEIVGVAATPHLGDLRDAVPYALFRPSLQKPQQLRSPIVLLASDRRPVDLSHDAKEVLIALGRERTQGFFAIEDYMANQLLPERLAAGLSSAFAVLVLTLVLTALYAVSRFQVEARFREFGIRVALGATRGSLKRRVISEGIALSAVGSILGALVTQPLGTYVRDALPGLQVFDLRTAIGTSALLLLMAVCATVAPARTAGSTEPVVLLRQN